MDSSIINKEGIEKLLTMLPSEEEVSRIEEAQEVNPELPLGTAEQFLITLSSINGLEVILASHWSILFILASHWSILLILASHWSILYSQFLNKAYLLTKFINVMRHKRLIY